MCTLILISGILHRHRQEKARSGHYLARYPRYFWPLVIATFWIDNWKPAGEAFSFYQIYMNWGLQFNLIKGFLSILHWMIEMGSMIVHILILIHGGLYISIHLIKYISLSDKNYFINQTLCNTLFFYSLPVYICIQSSLIPTGNSKYIPPSPIYVIISSISTTLPIPIFYYTI